MNEKRSNYQKQYHSSYKDKVRRVTLNFSHDEYRRFARAAGKQRVGSYIKRMALAGLDNQLSLPADLKDELQTLSFAVRNIANNVNQVAHRSNIVHNLTSADEHNLLQHLKQLDDTIRRYTEGRILETGQRTNRSVDDDY